MIGRPATTSEPRSGCAILPRGRTGHDIGLASSLCSETYGIVGGMDKTTVYLTAEQKRALARAARAEGRSQAELIREGIESVTARHRVAEPTIPLFESGATDLADRIDELLMGFGER